MLEWVSTDSGFADGAGELALDQPATYTVLVETVKARQQSQLFALFVVEQADRTSRFLFVVGVSLAGLELHCR